MAGDRIALQGRKGSIAAFAVVLAIGAVCSIFFFIEPGTSSMLPPCPFYWLTGLWCPGCGSGRALHALLHADILQAFDFNPLMMLSLPFLGYAGMSWLCLYTRGRPLPRIFTGRYSGWIVVCVVLVYWIARNIHVYPFTVLAP